MPQQAAATDPDKTVVLFTEEPRSQSAELPFTAVAVTPGFESPTISPLHDKQWNAVRVMVPKAKVNQLMDDLYEVGARGIIVTALQASRM